MPQIINTQVSSEEGSDPVINRNPSGINSLPVINVEVPSN